MVSSDLYQDCICGSVGEGCGSPVDSRVGGSFSDERDEASPCAESTSLAVVRSS